MKVLEVFSKKIQLSLLIMPAMTWTRTLKCQKHVLQKSTSIRFCKAYTYPAKSYRVKYLSCIRNNFDYLRHRHPPVELNTLCHFWISCLPEKFQQMEGRRSKAFNFARLGSFFDNHLLTIIPLRSAHL